MIQLFTIGVYESDEESFFNSLLKNQIELFIDIRQRRGVRGKKYKYVNKNRLIQKLDSLGIDYLHIKDLAPTKEIREQQKREDKVNSIEKRKRTELSKSFISLYKQYILEAFDFDSLIRKLQKENYKRILFFCVENNPQACHRSIVMDSLRDKYPENEFIHL